MTSNVVLPVIEGLTLALPLFLIGVFSPGPATIAIMSLSAKSGRRSGLVFALGVTTGSLFWGTAAGLGLGSLLTLYTEIGVVLRIAGGAYLLWLAVKLLRSCWQASALKPADTAKHSNLFIAGLALHLLNPKAMFVWMAVVSVGLTRVADPNAVVAQSIVMVCWLFSVVAFTGYAVLFSSEPVVAVYRQYARFIDGLCGALFTAAGLKLLFGS